MSVTNSSGTMTDGTNKIADACDFSQSEPILMLAEPAGIADQVSGRVVTSRLWRCCHTLSGTSICNTNRLSGRPASSTWAAVSSTANDKVLVVDDLLATGGTIEATVKLIRQLGGEVQDAAFVISLPDLGGEARLTALGLELVKLCEFEGE